MQRDSFPLFCFPVPMPAIHFIVKGKVQGVYFRESARKEAEKLQLTGWIRNNADRTVEGIVCGQEPALQTFLHWCHKGPVLAKVTKVITTAAEASDFSNFEVRR